MTKMKPIVCEKSFSYELNIRNDEQVHFCLILGLDISYGVELSIQFMSPSNMDVFYQLKGDDAVAFYLFLINYTDGGLTKDMRVRHNDGEIKVKYCCEDLKIQAGARSAYWDPVITIPAFVWRWLKQDNTSEAIRMYFVFLRDYCKPKVENTLVLLNKYGCAENLFRKVLTNEVHIELWIATQVLQVTPSFLLSPYMYKDLPPSLAVKQKKSTDKTSSKAVHSSDENDGPTTFKPFLMYHEKPLVNTNFFTDKPFTSLLTNGENKPKK
jgi:hypothetical protein